MKHLANFKQSGPLYLNQGDFPLEQLNSKDLYIEVSETFLKIKDNFLQEETNQSNEYNKNSAFLKNNRDASYQEDNKRYKKNTELSFQKNEAISFQEDEKALFLENGPSFYFGKNNQRLNEEHPNIPENQNFPHSKSNKIGCFPEKLDKSLEVKFSEFETPLNKLQILKQKRQKSLDYRILNQTYNLDKSFDNPTKDQSFDLFLQKEKNFQLKSEENVLKLKEMLEYNQSLEFYNTPKINKVNKILHSNIFI